MLATLQGCGFSGSANAVQALVSLQGTVHGGNQPVSGASVQLYAAGTGGPASAALPLLSNPVLSDSNGNFSIPASYICPSSGSQVYVVAIGGKPQLLSGASNPALALTAMLGSCSSLSTSSSITVNEVTTVGSVWPLAAYITSPSHVGAASNDTSFLNAVSKVPEFVNIVQGSSPGTPTATSYFAENSKLYSLANVIADCVDSSGGVAGDASPCGHLFSIATMPGSTPPTDTMTAAVRIAQNPDGQIDNIFGLAAADTSYQPSLTAAPNAWTLSLTYIVATPSMSPATGSYVGPQRVSISDGTAGSTIHYTTDGTTPTSSSPPYTEPIPVAVSSTVKAIAILHGSQSAIASATLTITSAQFPGKLAFSRQPSNALTQATISPAVQVAVQDSSGNVVTSASNPVTLALTSRSGLGGTLIGTPQNGVATFSNLTVNTAGVGYTLSATSPGMMSATSTAFNITSPVTAVIPPIAASLFGLSVLNFSNVSPTLQYSISRSWDVYPEVDWGDENPSRGIYDFTNLDKWTAVNQARGTDMIYTLGRTPLWASSDPTAPGSYHPGDCAPPTSMSDWDNYLTAIATHAAGKIRYWEIWNEPNDSSGYCGAIPTLVTMTQRANKIIKAIDPSAIILSPACNGGDYGNGPSWLGTFLGDGGAAYVDVIAFHGYGNGTAEDINTDIVPRFQSYMAANGAAGKPMWDTESDWESINPAPALARQTSYVAKSYLLHWSAGVSRFLWYAYDGTSTWGQLEISGVPTTAAKAYAQVRDWMVGATMSTRCVEDSNTGIWTCSLTRPGGYSAEAVWITNTSATLTVPARFIEYLDLAGTLHTIVNHKVPVADAPILIESSSLP